MKSNVSQKIDKCRVQRTKAVDSADRKIQSLGPCIRRMNVYLDALCREVEKQSRDSIVRFLFRYRKSAANSCFSTGGPYAYIKIALSGTSQSLGSCSRFDMSRAHINDRVGLVTSGLITDLDLIRLGEICGHAQKVDEIYSKLEIVAEVLHLNNRSRRDETALFDIKNNVYEIIDSIRRSLEERYRRLRLLEVTIDEQIHRFNCVMPKRYRSLVASWVYRDATSSQRTIYPSTAEYRVITSTGRTRGASNKRPRYSMPIDKFMLQEYGVLVRSKGTITWQLIRICRLGRYRKYILHHQSRLSPMISSWSGERERIQRIITVINTIEVTKI